MTIFDLKSALAIQSAKNFTEINYRIIVILLLLIHIFKKKEHRFLQLESVGNPAFPHYIAHRARQG